MNAALKNQTPALIATVLNYPNTDTYLINGRELTVAECNQYRMVIYTVMSGWLKQRIKALENFDAMRTKKADVLLTLLGVYEKASLQNICRFVAKNDDVITLLAPGEQSRCYKHYQTKVSAIVNFCKHQVSA